MVKTQVTHNHNYIVNKAKPQLQRGFIVLDTCFFLLPVEHIEEVTITNEDGNETVEQRYYRDVYRHCEVLELPSSYSKQQVLDYLDSKWQELNTKAADFGDLLIFVD